jgi:Xaa-Pro aminopeptidase
MLEPGYYEDGNFGIRIENIIRIVKATLPHNFADRGYLKFKDVTFVPIQQKMIKPELLTTAEVN